MTDDQNGQSPGDEEKEELVLDWDEALDDWEDQLDGSATAVSTPFPDRPEPASSTPAAAAEGDDAPTADPLTLPTEPPTSAIPQDPPNPDIVVTAPPPGPDEARGASQPPHSGPPTDPGPAPDFDAWTIDSAPPAGPPTDPGPAPVMTEPPAPGSPLDQATLRPPEEPSGAPGAPEEAAPHGHEARPLYRPPSEEEIEALRQERSQFPDDDEDATRIAAIPRELMEQLAADAAREADSDADALSDEGEGDTDTSVEGSGVFKPASGRQLPPTQPPPPNMPAFEYDAPEQEEQTEVLDFDSSVWEEVEEETRVGPPPSLPDELPSSAPPKGPPAAPPPPPPEALAATAPPPAPTSPASPPPASSQAAAPSLPPPAISSLPPGVRPPSREGAAAGSVGPAKEADLPPAERGEEGPIQAEPTRREKPLADLGAAAARRTVRSRKPRAERLPLVGKDDETREARRELLLELAERSRGEARSQLLVCAAELAEQAGDLDDARALYERAREAAPGQRSPTRALCRLARGRGDAEALAAGLEALLELPLAEAEKAHALCELAELRWRQHGTTEGALELALEAARIDPDGLEASLTVARLSTAARAEQSPSVLARLADRSADPQLSAALRTLAGRYSEAGDEQERALDAYKRALEEDPAAAGAALGMGRVLTTAGRYSEAAEAVQTLASLCVDDRIREAWIRQAARLLGHPADAPTRAAELLAGTDDPIALRTRADFAVASGDPELATAALEAWSQATQGTLRALAQLSLAELRAAAGDTEGCVRALAEAAEADAQLPLIAVVREVLTMRAAGDPRLTEALSEDEGDGQGALAAAAKLAGERDALLREREWLSRARDSKLSTVARALELDVAAEAEDDDTVRAELRDYADRCAARSRLGPLLALAEEARRTGDAQGRRAALEEALEAAPTLTLTLRAAGRAAPDHAAKAALWGREAEASAGLRRAFASLQQARSVDDEAAAWAALVVAHEASPEYAPAALGLLAAARRRGSLTTLADLHDELARAAQHPDDKVAHLARSALVRGAEQPDTAAAQLVEAAELAPGDAVVRELALRLGDALPPALRAKILEQGALHDPPAFKRAARLAAAGAREDAGDNEAAAKLYVQVLEEDGADPIAEAGLERVARACGDTSLLSTRRQRAVERARSEGSRVAALEGLVDLEQGHNPDGALESAQGILEIAPQHRRSLRMVERVLMASDEVDELLDVERRMLEVSKGALDRGARLRLIALLKARAGSDPDHASLDELLIAHGVEAAGDHWLARQLIGVGRARGRADAVRWGTELLAHGAQQPVEIVAAAVGRARALGNADHDAVIGILEEAVVQDPDHPIGREALAEARLRAGDTRGAAESFEDAARVSHFPRRAARLWHRAGCLWQDELEAPDRAKEAFQQAASADITYADVHARLENLLDGRNDLDGLISLTEAKIKAGGTSEQLTKLHRSVAKMYTKRGDRAAARAHLRDALSLSPEDVQALRELSELCLREKAWREATEVLIRIARLIQDPVELREVFFRLGEIYDEHLPDPRRAEAAYRRVLKLAPSYTEALRRLADLYVREGQPQKAAQALHRLSETLPNPTQRREAVLKLAEMQTALGDARAAEQTLEALRKQSPTDTVVLKALTTFYRQQGADAALAMHLGRAAADLRVALEEDPDDAALWTALVEVETEHGRYDAARVCASAAFALGLADLEVVERVDAEGGLTGAGARVGDELLDELLYPPEMPPSTRTVFRLAGEAFGKVLPFDIRAAGGEKLPRKHPLRERAREPAAWLGIGEPEIYVTSKLPNAFVPVLDTPVTLLVGAGLLEDLGQREKEATFLLVRAFKLASAHMSVVCRSKPDQLALVTMGLVRACMGDYAPPGVELDVLVDTSAKVAKSIPRRAREELLPAVIEMGGAPDFDPSRFYAHASAAANRAGLLAVGSVPASLCALCRLAGVPFSGKPGAQAVSKVEEARALLRFAISEAHFEARQRAGVDQA